MTKISQLTEEQEKYLPEFREECLKKALNTETIDRGKATQAIKRLYALNGFEEPIIIFADSPKQCVINYNIVKSFTSHEDIPGQLEKVLESGNYKSNELNVPGLWFVGGWEYYWLGFYKFGQHIGVNYEEQEKFDAYIDYADSCGVMYAYEGIAFVSDRPELIKFNDEKVLHNENGPAVRWRDGAALYSWNGTLVPEEWIENGVDVKTALTWENVEQRRCACEIIGWDKVLQDESLNPIVIDEDIPSIGTLIQVDLPEAPEQWFIKYQCGTGRWFAEAVNDKSFNTALKANAGGNGWRGEGDPMMYIPFIRT